MVDEGKTDWEILTEAKRSPKPFFDCGAKAAA